jgi:hypothetical protein
MDFDNAPDRLFGTDAAIWLERMGFNGKQVSKGAEQIGMSGRNFMRRRDGESDLTYTERLAMAAVRAGLPAWTPETDADLADYARLREIIEEMKARNGGE